MASGADVEDMNATPLGKLPMPVMQSKADTPRVDVSANTSYADILRGLGGDGAQATSLAAPPPQQQQPQLLAQQQLATPPQQPQLQLHQVLAPPPPPQQQQYYYDPPAYAAPARRRAQAKRRPARHAASTPARGTPLGRALGQYKNAAAVVAIVFAVMWWVAPKLAATLPSLAGPHGTPMRAPGVLLLAVLCGGIYRAAEHATAR